MAIVFCFVVSSRLKVLACEVTVKVELNYDGVEFCNLQWVGWATSKWLKEAGSACLYRYWTHAFVDATFRVQHQPQSI